MAPSRSKSDETQKSKQVSTLAKSLAPEEIRTGDYVSLLHTVCDFPAIVWCNDTSLVEQEKLIRLPLLPWENVGLPLQVLSVCLPFVLVKQPCGKQYSIDIRQHQLAKLSKSYVKTARKAFQSKQRKKKAHRKRNCLSFYNASAFFSSQPQISVPMIHMR